MIKSKYPKDLIIDTVFVICIFVVFILINIYRLNHWYYVSIGDEFEFWRMASSILNGSRPNIFSQNGGYGIIPVASSYFQAIVMLIFGHNFSGWKMAGIIASALSLIPIYGIARILFSRMTAWITTIITAASHYLWAYSRTGYPNVESIPLTLWSIWLFLLALSKHNMTLGFLSGIIAGSGWYTFYSSRLTIGILFIWYLFSGSKNKNLLTIISALIGFAVSVAPLFITNGSQVLAMMSTRSLSNPYPATDMTPFEHLLSNIRLSLLVWFKYQNDGHFPFLNGALLDPASALLFLTGIILFIPKIFKYPFNIIAVWFMLSLLTTGGMSQYVYPTVSRLHFLIPIIALISGYGCSVILNKISFISHKHKIFLIIPLSAFIFGFNIYHFFFKIPRTFPTTSESVIVKAYREACQNRKLIPYAIVRDPKGTTLNYINATGLLDNKVVLYSPDDQLTGYTSRFMSSCLIVEPDFALTPIVINAVNNLKLSSFYVSDNTNRVKVMVLLPDYK